MIPAALVALAFAAMLALDVYLARTDSDTGKGVAK